MDFLDPVKRRRHVRRLIIGYILVAIMILLTARIFVFWASGESINPKTGQIVEYGLMFVDSKPGGANIYLNDQSVGTTSARLNLAAGNYKLSLKRDGYQDWNNKLSLGGQTVTRIVYPLLFPKELKPQALKNFAAQPPLISQSQDRRWLLVEQISGTNFSFEVFDTSKNQPVETRLDVPSALLTNTDKANQALTIVAWAADNTHFLLKHSYDGGQEFAVLSRSDPADSVNLNRQFNTSASAAAFNGDKADQILLYSQADQSLSLANLSRGNLNGILPKVSDWQAVDNNLIIYLTEEGASPGQISVKIWDSGKSYKLADMPKANRYLFNGAQYQSHWYYAIGTDSLGRVLIYRDPLDSLRSDNAKASPFLSLLTSGEPELTFSLNGRFISVESGTSFNIYDFDTQTRYRYTIAKTPDRPLAWMDSYRLLGLVDGKLFEMDFDGQNQHQLIAAQTGSGLFDGPYNRMFSLAPTSTGGASTLQMTELRAGADLPK